MRRWRINLAAFPEKFFFLRTASAIEFTHDGVRRRDPVTAGRVCVDSGSLEEIEDVVIRDRKHLPKTELWCPSSRSTNTPAKWNRNRRS